MAESKQQLQEPPIQDINPIPERLKKVARAWYEAQGQVEKRVKSGNVAEAIWVTEQYHSAYGRLNQYTYNFLLKAAVDSKNPTFVQKVLHFFEAHRIPYNTHTFINLIQWYSINRDIRSLNKLWIDLVVKHPQYLNADVFGELIRALRMHNVDQVVVEKVLAMAAKFKFEYNSETYCQLFLMFKQNNMIKHIIDLYKRYKQDISDRGIDADPHVLLRAILTFYRTAMGACT